MKKFLAAALLAGAAVIAATIQVHAQAAVQVQVVAACSSQSWPLNVTRPLTQKQNGDLCTNATGGGGGSSLLTAIAALPTLAPGDQQPRGSLAGAAYVQPVFGSTAGGGTQVDSTHGMPVAGIGSAGTAAGGVLTIQGVASMTKLLVTPDANSSVNISQVNGTTILVNAGVTGTGSPRTTQAQDTTTVAGAAPLTTGIFVTGPSAAALATAALQTTGNTSLSTIATNTGNIVTDAHFQAVVGTKNAGTAAANSLQVGAVYNSTPLTLTNTQQASLQGDANGYLKVNVAAGGAGGGAVYGPTAVGGTAANPPVLIGGTSNATGTGTIQIAKVDSSGNVSVAGGVTDGAAVASALYNTVAAVAETAPSACTTATQCFMSLNPTNRALRVNIISSTSGGSLNDPYEPVASDNHRTLKNGIGTLRGIQYSNNSATVNYLRYYNLGTGFNACNSASGLLYELAIPANTSVAGFAVGLPPSGIAFSTGLSMCVTSGYGQTNTTSATATAMEIDTQYD